MNIQLGPNTPQIPHSSSSQNATFLINVCPINPFEIYPCIVLTRKVNYTNNDDGAFDWHPNIRVFLGIRFLRIQFNYLMLPETILGFWMSPPPHLFCVFWLRVYFLLLLSPETFNPVSLRMPPASAEDTIGRPPSCWLSWSGTTDQATVQRPDFMTPPPLSPWLGGGMAGYGPSWPKESSSSYPGGGE